MPADYASLLLVFLVWLHNEKGSKVEANVAMCPVLSLFRREENRDGDTYVPYALHSY